MPSPVRSRAAALLLLAFIAPPVWAQTGGSGSSTGFFSAHNAPTAGGRSSTAAVNAEVEVGHATTGPIATSPNYEFRGTVLWAVGPPSTTQPVVFGVEGGSGDKDGGITEIVRGYNMSNGGVPAVDFGAGAGLNPTVVSNTTLTIDTPPGVDGNANPLAEVDVTVTHAFGSDTAADAYAYTPAIVAGDPPRIGKLFRAHHIADPGTFVFIALGLSSGFAVPFPPFDGAFDLLQNVFFSTALLPVPSGSLNFFLFVPNDPTLVGFPLQLQGLSLDLSALPTLGGSFTNRMTAVIQGS